jgi:hypothetical protein
MKITLKFDHTHGGVDYKAGAQIDVPLIDAIWLKGEDLIEEAFDAIKAEAKKLATKDNPAPHADEIAAAIDKADAKAEAAQGDAQQIASALAAAPAATTTAGSAVATQDTSAK